MTAQSLPTGLASIEPQRPATGLRTPRVRAALAWSAAIACALAVFLGPRTADAKSQRDSAYLYRQVWPAAVRLLRVDAGYKIIEKDVESGYVLFEAKDDGKKFRGALEIAKLENEGGKRVRVIIRIEDRPSYMELSLLDKLERKLRDEYGPPPKGKKPDPDMDARH